MRHRYVGLPAALVLLVAVMFACVSPGASRGAEKYALLVGVKQYRKQELRSLSFTENDVGDLAKVLMASGYPEENVVLLTKAHADEANDSRFVPQVQNIRDELELLVQEVREGDTLLVAFSGHGVQFKGDPAGYFCPSDGRLKDRRTLVSLEEVYQSLAACQATTRLLIVDACRNDPRGGVADVDKGTIELDPVGVQPPAATAGGVAALSSCSPQERSYEDPDLGHGVFLNFLIEGLRGKADLAAAGEQPDGKITLSELQEYAVRNTQKFVRNKLGVGQTPQERGEVQGSVVLATVPRTSAPPARPKPLDVIENTIGMKLVLIPAGEFDMGSPAGEEGRDEDETPHHVRLTHDFFLGQTEVTVAQFRRFVSEKGYQTEAETDGRGGWGWNESTGKFEGLDPKYNWRKLGFAQTDEHPVVNVSWNDAQAFVQWLSGKEKAQYRLPTEAEWEYACRAGSQAPYSFGSDPKGLAAAGNIADATAEAKWTNYPSSTYLKARDGYIFTAPVGSFRANAFKLFDMHGNVWECCSDWYDSYGSGTQTDPTGPASGEYPAGRGGGWYNAPQNARSARRVGNPPAYRSNDLGFRVARQAP